MLAPVVIFVYNRERQTRQMLAALNENLLASETEAFVFCDGPKNDIDAEKVNAVRKCVKEFAKTSGFKKIQIIESERNKGLANSIINGVTQIIDQYGKVIVLEDDLVTAPVFLKFMNDCLNFYADNQKVWSIGGTTYDMDALKNYPKSVYACYRGESWGWATWIDRWKKVDWNVSDYDSFVRDKKKCREFQRGGEDILIMLKRQMRGEIDSWAIRWCYQEFKEDMVTILPVKSLIKNIGFDGSGTHSGTVEPELAVTDNDKFNYILENVEIDEKIMDNYRKYNQRSFATKVLDLFGIKIKRKKRKHR